MNSTTRIALQRSLFILISIGCCLISKLYAVTPSLTKHTSIAYLEKGGVYEYPITPDDPGWNDLTSTSEMFAVCQIPEDILSELSTSELMDAILDYPLLPIWVLQQSEEDAYEMFSRHFSAISEFISREDARDEIERRLIVAQNLNARGVLTVGQYWSIKSFYDIFLKKINCASTDSSYSIVQPFDYPDIPMNSSGESVNDDPRIQIPKRTIQEMTTQALLDTILSFPFLSDILVYDSYELGLLSAIDRYPALNELVTELFLRADALETIQGNLELLSSIRGTSVESSAQAIYSEALLETIQNQTLVEDSVQTIYLETLLETIQNQTFS